METRQWMSILLILATALMLFIALLSYQKRRLQVARTMVFIMLGASCYALGYAFEILSTSLRGVKLSLQLEYLGIPFVSTLWLLLVIQFTGAAAQLRRRITFLLFIIPVLIFLLHLTNDWHQLIYKEYITNTNAAVPLYTTIKGPFYILHGVYNYLILLFGILLFIPMYLRSLPIVRKQIIVLVLGAAAPMLLNFVFLFGLNVDMTPIGFAVSGVVYVWGIFRFNLLRLTPLALAKVFETIRDGVVLFDYEDQIVSYNQAAEQVFPELGAVRNYPAKGTDIFASWPDLLERISAAENQEERFSFQHMQGKQLKHFICSLSFIYDTGVSPIGKMLMFNDITELMENEERLRENARQLSQLNSFKDKLFTVVAHDIRDPIALLVSLTELLGEEPKDADLENAEVFQEIKKQVRGTFHLVDNLLDWYRSQNGRIAFRPQAWNLQQVVRQAMSLAGGRASMKQIHMIESVDETLTVNADKEMLDLILRNLLSNAIKYTGLDGRIEIGAVLEGELVRVSVKDNGAGIDEETANLLTQEELYFKETGSLHAGSEMRFGLVLSREFLRIHGGSLQFESTLGEGTNVLFTLPGFISGGAMRRSEGMEVEALESHTG